MGKAKTAAPPPGPKDSGCLEKGIELDGQRDNDSYFTRLYYYAFTTFPLKTVALNSTLDNAKRIVTDYKAGRAIPECLTPFQLWRQKYLHDSAEHPFVGERMFCLGRMCATTPINMLLGGALMTFHKSIPAIIFWQALNQGYNTLVNYTNRSGEYPDCEELVKRSVVASTIAAVVTALALRGLCSYKNLAPLYCRLFPFAGVTAGHVVNTPYMRFDELYSGTRIYDEKNKELAKSTAVANEGTREVVISRILMAAPPMLLTPFIMNHLERRGTLCRYPWLGLPGQIGLLGLVMLFSTPMVLALFKQRPEFESRYLEETVRSGKPAYVYYNKGV